MSSLDTMYRDLWTVIAAVGAAVWLVTFAVVGFGTSNEAFRNLGRTSSARFTMYYAALLTSANIVAPVLAALHWLSPVSARDFVDGGAIVGNTLAWGGVGLAIVGVIFRPAPNKARIRQAVLLTAFLFAEVIISWRDLFGSEEWAANGATTQLALAFAVPMLAILYVGLRREFPRLVARLEGEERGESDEDDRQIRLFIAK